MDPMTLLSAVAAALSSVDKFVEIIRKMRGLKERPFKVKAEKENDKLVIKRDGRICESISADQLKLNKWDGTRFTALQERLSSLWSQYNGIYSQLPNVSIDERIRLEQRMKQMELDLCRDFQEMVRISEQALGSILDDHYTLYEICDKSS